MSLPVTCKTCGTSFYLREFTSCPECAAKRGLDVRVVKEEKKEAA